MLKTPKGTYDILPSDCPKWQFFERVARDCFLKNNYQEIRTPVFEHTELFVRGVGESTDIVNKEMYTFEKSERQLSLRPENTAGVVRAFIEHGMTRWPKPVKLFYLGPMFRYERPQAGRQRQFYQLGVESFGLDTPEMDVEVIQLAISILKALGLNKLSLEINSLGTSETRGTLNQLIQQLTKHKLVELCEDCQRRYQQNPLRMLDCKIPTCKQIYEDLQLAEKMSALILENDTEGHFKKVCQYLDTLKIKYTHNPKLVRGLDYYTKTVFEITSDNLGSQNAVCGGGRYNNLVKQLGGPQTHAVGWAMGVERLLSLLPDPEKQLLDYFLTSDNTDAAFSLVQLIREIGYSIEMDLSGKAVNKQFEVAKKANPKYLLQLENEQLKVKDFQENEVLLELELKMFLKHPLQYLMDTYKY